MRKTDMTPSQIRDTQIFNLILECYGWDDSDETEKRLDNGESMKPEGVRYHYNRYYYLEARYHAPVNMISLRIKEKHSDEQVQFHFLFDNRPERILEWIAANMDTLTLEGYQDSLHDANRHCEMILLEKSDMEIYEVKPTPPRVEPNN